jgi:membrane associated rhomboid family serine protease
VIPLRDSVPARAFPVVTVGLIALNFVVWAWELSGPGVDARVGSDGFYPCTVHGPCASSAPAHPLLFWEAAVISMFMHAGWAHILGNMLFLWIFGNNVEDALGHVRFLVWYLVAGIFAIATQAAVTLAVGTTQDASIPNIGASGAIAGVLGAYFVLYPRARVLTAIFLGIIFFRELPAVWFLGIWIVLQLWAGGISILHPQAGGGTAFFAHIGGFAFGAATILFVARQKPARTLLR